MQLRPFQVEALKRLRKPIQLLCIAPTGSGKSLIYEKIAAKKGTRTLLITPLVALARQQSERLREKGIPVVLSSGVRPRPAAPKGTGVWILSPESLRSDSSMRELEHWSPDFLVVDECHCLYDWGERFRTAFLRIPDLVRKLKIQRSLWLSATLPIEAQVEIEQRLGKRLERVGCFELPSQLFLEVRRAPWVNRAELLLDHCAREREPGIVFVNTRDAAHRVSRLLETFGRKAIAYHAGMSREERSFIEKTLTEKSDSILVATSAFGMGMDYAHFRWAVLWQPPPTLLALAQAIGRVSRRSDLPVRASVFWDDEDFRSLRWMVEGSERQSHALETLHSFLQASECRARQLELFFNGFSLDRPEARCGHCDRCGPLIH